MKQEIQIQVIMNPRLYSSGQEERSQAIKLAKWASIIMLVLIHAGKKVIHKVYLQSIKEITSYSLS